jgi:hypothetical protein
VEDCVHHGPELGAREDDAGLFLDLADAALVEELASLHVPAGETPQTARMTLLAEAHQDFFATPDGDGNTD